MPTIEDAIILATQQHRFSDPDKGGQPYILHPLAVMLRMDTEAERITAVLHDVVEDTEVTFEDLRGMGYSNEVIDALACLTNAQDPTEEPDKNERYRLFIERVATNPIAVRVKLADLSENMNVWRLRDFDDDSADRMKRYHRAYRRLIEINTSTTPKL